MKLNFLHLYLSGAVILAASAQLLLKWRLEKLGKLPVFFFQKIACLTRNLLDPFVILSVALGVMSFFLWMSAIAESDLSYAYPFMGAIFVLIFIFSVLLFREPVTLPKVIGQIFIVFGIVISGMSR